MALRVLLVEEGGVGGVAEYTRELARALTRAGCEVHLATARDYELEPTLRQTGGTGSPSELEPTLRQTGGTNLPSELEPTLRQTGGTNLPSKLEPTLRQTGGTNLPSELEPTLRQTGGTNLPNKLEPAATRGATDAGAPTPAGGEEPIVHRLFPYVRGRTALGRAVRRAGLSRAVNGVTHLAARPRVARLARGCDVVHVQGGEWPPLAAAQALLVRAAGRPVV